MVGRDVYSITVDGVEMCIQQLGRVEEMVVDHMMRKRKLRHVAMARKVTLPSIIASN